MGISEKEKRMTKSKYDSMTLEELRTARIERGLVVVVGEDVEALRARLKGRKHSKQKKPSYYSLYG